MHQDDFCIVNPGGCIIHFPANGRYILDIHDPDFSEQYQRLLERLDYLKKPGTKALDWPPESPDNQYHLNK
ncbi:YagK/YfjJ domain-containing protein [Escherichia coli]|uniref:YagK/YfjJ domain-containing protein n=1 Tax=Escherichia coli TaxID=562 RepID=UPI0023797524|nr:inovirus-type Gp2 protein [Escherichia coli]WDN80037.1 inovirus Gp2 family protein [Escherichia coli]